MTPMAENWGTVREDVRRGQRRALVKTAVVTVLLVPLAASFLLGLVEGLSGADYPDGTLTSRNHAGYVGIAMVMTAVVAFNLRIWRSGDEFERQQMARAIAIAGIVTLVALPVLALAQAPLRLPSPAILGWGLGLVTLVGTRILQRLRG